MYAPGDEHAVLQVMEQWIRQHVSSDEKLLLLNGGIGERYINFFDSVFSMIKPAENIAFKKYCGEYPVASAFAVWTAWKALQEGMAPVAVIVNRDPRGYCSFIVLRRC